MKQPCLSPALLVLCGALALPACVFPGVLKVVPGINERGLAPATWEVDLRGATSESLRALSPMLSSRLYGKASPLHHALLVRTDSKHPTLLGIGVKSVSSGGSDLVVKTNGVLVGRQVWPAGKRTHAVETIYYVPLAPGSNTTSIEVSDSGGVVVLSALFSADSLEGLPQKPVTVAFKTGTMAPASRTNPFESFPMTGGKLESDDGYRGIWYYNQSIKNEYKFKYSGGFATYPYQHVPIAIYAKQVDKTFFVYGGTTARDADDKQELLHMISYYDHKTGKVPRPRILLNKRTEDAHDNPTLQIDDLGYLWIFSSSHGTGRPSFIHRSTKPYAIEEFERVWMTNFSYTQPWYVSEKGFLFLHTRYGGGRSLGISAARCLFAMSSKDGVNWNRPEMLAGIGMGDYQVSWINGSRVATAFDFHPIPEGLNSRANIYYMESPDLGSTWRNVRGEKMTLPLVDTNNGALVYDSRKESKLVYLMDINFDLNGRPVILYLTSKGFEPGPENGPREWQTLRWTGTSWVRRSMTTSGNNYDHGSLYIEPDGTWRVIGPTELGPQPYNPGGEVVIWTSTDEGATWRKSKQITRDSKLNHTFVRRPVNAHPEFYAMWADGNGREPSQSSIYFTDKHGKHVCRLPAHMAGEFAMPDEVSISKQ